MANDVFRSLSEGLNTASTGFQRRPFGKALNVGRAQLLPGFITIGFVMTVIIIITSSIGISEYGKLTKDERNKMQSGYTAQIVFLVIALLSIIGLVVLTALMYGAPKRP
jgi:uncharacterized membrane protein YidH (DUF202 family)